MREPRAAQSTETSKLWISWKSTRLLSIYAGFISERLIYEHLTIPESR